MNLSEATDCLIKKRGESLAFTSVSLGYGGFSALVSHDRFKEIYIGIPGAFRVWLRLDGTYNLDVPNEASIPLDNYLNKMDESLKIGEKFTIIGGYKKRSFFEWITRKEKEEKQYIYEKDGVRPI